MSVCGAVLAAGAGSRFEPGPKQLARLDGRPLIDHSLDALRGAPSLSRRLVVLGSGAEEIEARADLEGFELARCGSWSAGLSESLRVAVRVAEQDSSCEALLILLADQPLVSARAVERLAARARELGPQAALRAGYHGRAGHPSVIGRALFAAVGRIEGDRGAGGILEEAGAALVDVSGLGSDIDVDTRADLEAIDREAADGEIQTPAASRGGAR
ncbi:nucleotidyltransferase family protein [Thermoleophilia bacterium SCSIO 60948]|nr:nucleotidyltransferase family protein [Thermoleophilia bacterium SCSIO 60948]